LVQRVNSRARTHETPKHTATKVRFLRQLWRQHRCHWVHLRSRRWPDQAAAFDRSATPPDQQR